MEYRQITDDYAVSGQISPDDIAAIKAAGFRSIICNRPDDEQPGQPSAAEIAVAAAAAELHFRHIPFTSGQMTPEDVQKMTEALDEIPGPVFAFCRSGARSANIFMAAEQEKRRHPPGRHREPGRHLPRPGLQGRGGIRRPHPRPHLPPEGLFGEALADWKKV